MIYIEQTSSFTSLNNQQQRKFFSFRYSVGCIINLAFDGWWPLPLLSKSDFTKKLSRLSRWIKSRWDRCCRPDGILFSGAGEGARIALYSASGGGNACRDVTSDVVLSFPPIGSRISSPLSSTILQKCLRTDTITAKRRAQVFPFCHLLVLTWLLFSVDHSYSHSYAGYLSRKNAAICQSNSCHTEK